MVGQDSDDTDEPDEGHDEGAGVLRAPPALPSDMLRGVREAARAGAGFLEPDPEEEVEPEVVAPAPAPVKKRRGRPPGITGAAHALKYPRGKVSKTAWHAGEEESVNGTAREPTSPAARDRVAPPTKTDKNGLDVLFPRLLDPFSIDDAYAPNQPQGVEGDLARRKIAVERWWGAAFAEAKVSAEDLFPYRCRMAWRVTREFARIRGIADEYQSLELATLATDRPDGKDPWTKSAGINWRKDMEDKLAVQWNILKLLSPQRTNQENEDVRGLGLLPPPVPANFVDQYGKVRDEYDPDEDKRLNRWLAAVGMVVTRLGIDRGSVRDRQQGYYGLRFVLDPRTTRLVWPSRWDIMALEYELIDECLRLTIEKGISGTRADLKEKYGFTERELQMLVNLARMTAHKRQSHDLEEQRSMTLLRLEDIMNRARLGLDLRAEIQAIKAAATIQGLNKGEPEDSIQDFARVVQKVTKGLDKSYTGAIRGPAPPKQIEARFTARNSDDGDEEQPEEE